MIFFTFIFNAVGILFYFIHIFHIPLVLLMAGFDVVVNDVVAVVVIPFFF